MRRILPSIQLLFHSQLHNYLGNRQMLYSNDFGSSSLPRFERVRCKRQFILLPFCVRPGERDETLVYCRCWALRCWSHWNSQEGSTCSSVFWRFFKYILITSMMAFTKSEMLNFRRKSICTHICSDVSNAEAYVSCTLFISNINTIGTTESWSWN